MVFVSAIEGNSQWLDGGAMFGNVPRALWQKWHQPDELGRIRLATRGLLIEDEASKIKVLCETGVGNFFPPHLAKRYGVENSDENLLLRNLHACGVSADEINYVILSHLHFDHVGGLIAADGALNFPNAHYLVGARALARAEQAHRRDHASFIADLPSKLRSSKRLVLIEGADDIPVKLRGKLEFIFTEGHTVGQMHVLWGERHNKMFFASDLIPGCAWVHLAITAGYDRYPELLIDEKQALYERALQEKWLLFFMHDIDWVAAHIANEQGKYRAVDQMSSLSRYRFD
ncbi:MAG: MBL fold metallo-hydrolase [Pseudomonadota bacterium]|nr:MBL fold metallo-hydrolase [Pseudomonadota bacterium]